MFGSALAYSATNPRWLKPPGEPIRKRTTAGAFGSAAAEPPPPAAKGTAASADLRLVEAVQRRDQAATQILLKESVDVNAAQPDGATALAWAAHWDDLQSATRLIAAGANVNAANELGVTPLMLACANGSTP